MKKTDIIITVTVLVCFVCFGCEDVQNALQFQKPTASIKGVSFEDVSLDSATLLFDVQVDNPYPVTLPLTNLDYSLTSDKQSLLGGAADIATTIPAKESRVVSLPATVKYLELAKAFKDFRPGSKIPYRADVGLSVDTPTAGKLRLPLKKTGSLNVPSIPRLDELDLKGILSD